eukprot:232983-Pelagomonas_calceolata.AAC.2
MGKRYVKGYNEIVGLRQDLYMDPPMAVAQTVGDGVASKRRGRGKPCYVCALSPQVHCGLKLNREQHYGGRSGLRVSGIWDVTD